MLAPGDIVCSRDGFSTSLWSSVVQVTDVQWRMSSEDGARLLDDFAMVVAVFPDRQGAPGNVHVVLVLAYDRLWWTWSTVKKVHG